MSASLETLETTQRESGSSLTVWQTGNVSSLPEIYVSACVINFGITDDMYNIPKVTDCTHELNEWVYSGDRTRLMSTQPRQLPELVRRFTQDIYMCVYIQPDVALYGDDDDWSLQENSSEEPRTSEHLTGCITNSESVSLLHEELSRLYIETRPIKVCFLVLVLHGWTQILLVKFCRCACCSVVFARLSWTCFAFATV